MDSKPTVELAASRDRADVGPPRRRTVHAAASVAGAVLIHATAFAAFLAPWSSSFDDAVDGAPAIVVELAPMTAAPARQASDLAPGPLAPKSEGRTKPAHNTTAPDPDERKSNLKNAGAGSALETAPKREAAEQSPQEPTHGPLVVLATPTPAEPIAQPKRSDETPPKRVESGSRSESHPHKQSKSQLASRASAPSAAVYERARTAALSPGANTRDDSAVPSWRSLLMARLERSKRYPADGRGDQGVALLAFSIDHQGKVHGARIVRSSGSRALDRETMSMIARAQPLPPPPPQLAGRRIAITVPIRYSVH